MCKAFTEGEDEGGQAQVHKPIAVTSSICRASYGTPFQTPFDEEKHLEEDKVWDDDEGMWKAGNQMEWYLKRVCASTPCGFWNLINFSQGESVSNAERISHSFYRIYNPGWDGRFSDTIYQCDDPSPPSRMEPSVEEVCSFDCTLENCMPVSRLKNHFTPDKKKKKMLNYNLRMLPSGRSLKVDVEVNGTRLGNANVDIKF